MSRSLRERLRAGRQALHRGRERADSSASARAQPAPRRSPPAAAGGTPFASLASLAFSRREPLFGLPLADGDLCFDLETTGLRSSDRIFLAGILLRAGEALRLEQDVVGDASEEGTLLERLGPRLDSASRIITYNGKSFDLPFLRRRLRYHGLPPLRKEPQVVDLLHIARRAFRGQWSDFRLSTLERHLLGRTRVPQDVPSAEVPLLFLDYCESGRREILQPVLEHNRIDLLSLARVLPLLRAPERPAPDHGSSSGDSEGRRG